MRINELLGNLKVKLRHLSRLDNFFDSILAEKIAPMRGTQVLLPRPRPVSHVELYTTFRVDWLSERPGWRPLTTKRRWGSPEVLWFKPSTLKVFNVSCGLHPSCCAVCQLDRSASERLHLFYGKPFVTPIRPLDLFITHESLKPINSERKNPPNNSKGKV